MILTLSTEGLIFVTTIFLLLGFYTVNHRLYNVFTTGREDRQKSFPPDGDQETGEGVLKEPLDNGFKPSQGDPLVGRDEGPDC